MLSHFFRPALGRRSMPFGGHWLAAFWLVAIAFALTFPVLAHEGHVHEAPSPTAASGLPRLLTNSESYELVAILDGKQLTIYLDRFADNEPVTDASIEVAVEGETVTAERNPDGTYGVTSNRFGDQGFVELVFDIRASVDDLLIGKLLLSGNLGRPTEPASWYGWPAALRHGAEEHLVLLGLVAFCGLTIGGLAIGGLAIGLALRPRRRTHVSSILILTTAALAIVASARSAKAHEGHADDNRALIAPSDTTHVCRAKPKRTKC
jgi:membrane fusion protein, heavy metal efflux system